jgi:hypothetical protein
MCMFLFFMIASNESKNDDLFNVVGIVYLLFVVFTSNVAPLVYSSGAPPHEKTFSGCVF